jgi:hypothetical protein
MRGRFSIACAPACLSLDEIQSESAKVAKMSETCAQNRTGILRAGIASSPKRLPLRWLILAACLPLVQVIQPLSVLC